MADSDLSRDTSYFFFFTYFEITIGMQEVGKINVQGGLYTLHITSPKVVTLQNYGAVSVPGNSSWYNLQSCYGFHQFYMHPHVCACVCMCVGSYTASCNHHHNLGIDWRLVTSVVTISLPLATLLQPHPATIVICGSSQETEFLVEVYFYSKNSVS